MDSEQAEAFISDIGTPTAVILFEANDAILQERLKSRYIFDLNNHFFQYFWQQDNTLAALTDLYKISRPGILNLGLFQT